MVPSPPQPTAGSPHNPPTTAADSQHLPTTVKDTKITPGIFLDENSEKEKVEFFTLYLKVRKYIWLGPQITNGQTFFQHNVLGHDLLTWIPVLLMDFLCESKHKYVNLEELFSSETLKISNCNMENNKLN